MMDLKVVVRQHHIGGFLGYVRARDAHRDANVSGLQGRRVVYPVPCHRYYFVPALQSPDDAKFVFRADTGVRRYFLYRLVQRLVRHLLQLGAGYRPRLQVAGDAELSGDNGRGNGMVAGDHDGAYARHLRARDRFFRFFARGVDHANQPRENEILLKTLIHLFDFERIRGQRAEGHAERTQRLACKFLILLQYGGAPLIA